MLYKRPCYEYKYNEFSNQVNRQRKIIIKNKNILENILKIESDMFTLFYSSK